MIVNADAKGLEWRVAMFYSQDPVGIKEILDGVSVHDVNKEYFGFKEKVHAKTFLFRLVYGGTKYGFANDSVMSEVNSSPKYWQGIIDKTYKKYEGLAKWHKKIKQEARETGRLVTPSGREYSFSPVMKRGQSEWPDAQILNYPVQGFGADIMKIARLAIYNRLKSYRESGVLLVNTVHDSIMVDCKDEHTEFVCKTINDVFTELPEMLEKCFKISYNIPMPCEISVGDSWGTLEEVNV